MKGKRPIIGLVVGAMVCLAVALAGAVPAFAATDADKWEIKMIPYGWMIGIDGDLTVGDQDVDIDVGFDDVWDNLEIAGMLQLEMRKDRFGLFAQPNYLKVTDEDTLSAVNGEIETQAWMVEFGAFYRLVENPGNHPLGIDLLLGGRFWDLSNTIEVGVSDTEIVEAQKSNQLIDPIVGLRLGNYFTDRLFVMLRGDVGGFDIGGSTTKFSWQAQAVLGFDVTDSLALFGGYRVLDIDTDLSNETEADLTLYGPIVGLGFVF